MPFRCAIYQPPDRGGQIPYSNDVKPLDVRTTSVDDQGCSLTPLLVDATKRQMSKCEG